MKAVILRFNQPAIIIPVANLKATKPHDSGVLLSVELTSGETYLGYHIKFED